MTNSKDHFNIEKTSIRQLLILVFFILVGVLFSNLLSLFVWRASGLDLTSIMNGEPLDEGGRNIFRIGLMINHIGMFLLPGIFFLKILHKDNWASFLKLKTTPDLASLIGWGVVILCSYPIIAQLTVWNLDLPLPEWMRSSQDEAFAILGQTLKMTNATELLISIFLVGVLAAVGEELIFRGIIQRYFQNEWNNHHISILVSALIFGGFHLQFERILPLTLLGIVLGYSYHYSKNLAVPIILHFLNNTLQVIGIYTIGQSNSELPDLDSVPELPLGLVVSSIILGAIIAYSTIQTSLKKDESRS